MATLFRLTRTWIKLHCLCSFILSFSFNPTFRPITSTSLLYMSTQNQNTASSTISFAGITFSEPISTSLSSMGIVSASPIQKAAISDLVHGLSAILHAETGSGKTLAYILPLLKKLQISSIGYQNTTPSIQAFIIVPTKELAVQVAADIITLLGKASLINSISSSSPSDVSEFVHLCISTNRQGLDNVQSPIVIGTPVKIADAMRMSSANTFKSIHYIVLDEVDRLLSVMGKYATAEEKQKANDTENPTEMILSNLLMRVKKTSIEREEVQIVAVSATIGRPLRRELCRIVSGGTSFEGNFPIIRGNNDINDNDNDNDSTTTTTTTTTNNNNNNMKNDKRSVSNSVEDLIEMNNNNNSGNNRKVGIPSKIKHQCVLVDCEIDDISTKIVKAKEKWLLYSKIHSQNNPNPNPSSSTSTTTTPPVHRGILFVPRQADVKQCVGMLRFWGLKECVDLQAVLGLENAKPIGNTQQQGVSTNNNNRRIYRSNNNNNRDNNSKSSSGDNKKRMAEIERNRVPEVQRKVSDIIALAQKSGLGASSPITTASTRGSSTRDSSVTENENEAIEEKDEISNQQQQQQHAAHQKGDALFVAPVNNARGLHLQNIETVFITHCPKTMDEYLHMAGRTGRMSAMNLQLPSTTATPSSIIDKDTKNTPQHHTAAAVGVNSASTVISFVNYDELKRLQSWQVPLGIELEILFD